MSAETWTAVEDAISAHIADESDTGPRLLTDWYLISASVGGDGETTYYQHATSESSQHVLAGLSLVAYRRMLRYLDGNEDDE